MTTAKMILEPYGITLHLKSNWFFSFGDSPYYAHYNGSAIDLYEGIRGFESRQVAISPISGKVIFIEKVKAPKKRNFSSEDYIIGIAPEENESLIIRILHIRPNVNKGDYIDVGDQLGYFIRSGFFNVWTDPHMHLEVRKSLIQFLIARGALPIIKKTELSLLDNNVLQQDIYRTIILEVERVSKNYVLAKPKINHAISAFDNIRLYGVPLFKGFPNLLDAGIPYYKRGLIIFRSLFDESNNSALEYILVHSRTITLKIFHDTLEYIAFRGVGTALYLSPKNLRVKLVPFSLKNNSKESIQEGDILTLRLGQKM